MTAPAFDAIVATLTSHGTERPTAERMARAKLGLPEPVADLERAAKDASVAEKQEQHECVNLARALGCVVYNLSQARASKQTAGLGDMWITCSARQFAGWFEVKRRGGVRSTAQVEFGEQCEAAKIPYAFGDRYAFARWLLWWGFEVDQQFL